MSENYVVLFFTCFLAAHCKCNGRTGGEAPHPVSQGNGASNSVTGAGPLKTLDRLSDGVGDRDLSHFPGSEREKQNSHFPGSERGKQSPESELSWYDPGPLLVSLRSHIPRGAAAAAGVGRLSELPLYDLQIELNSREPTFLVKENLWFTNTGSRPLREIVLRLYANTAGTRHEDDRASVRFLAGQCTRGPQCQIQQAGPSALSVRLQKELPPMGRVCIRLDLLGRLQQIDSSRTNIFAQGLEGMAMMNTHGAGGNYGLLSRGDGITSLAHFYAVLAKRYSGRWKRKDRSTMGDLGSDEMAHVRATIVTEPGVRVASTGVRLASPSVRKGGRQEIVFGAALVRDFSILLSSEFDVSTKRAGEVEVQSYFLRPERKAGLAALDAAVFALQLFEKRFGPYPYRDFDVVEAPLVGGAGGVEFAGLVTVASMLYRPADHSLGHLSSMGNAANNGNIATKLLDSMLEFVVVHEVAHQYWHGLVGSDSREHPFDDEALAQFSTLLYMEERYGLERARKEAEMQVAMGYRMMRMVGTPDGAADRPVASFDTPLAYGGLVYGKAPFVYRELRRAVGDHVFFQTLREYVEKYQFRLAPNRAFIALLAEKNSSVDPISRRWLDENHGDEDLGKGSMSDLMNMIMGPEHASAMKALGLDSLAGGSEGDVTDSPGMKQLMKDLEKLGSTGDPPNGKELEQLEKLLNEQFGSP